MKRRRVIQILEATTGGTRRHLVDLVMGLDPQRFEVRVICALARDPAFREDVAAMQARSIPVHIVPMVRTISPWKDGHAYRQLVRLLREHPCDVVHTHSSKAGVLGRLAARRAGIGTVVHTPHVFPFDMQVNAAVRVVYRFIERRLARRTDRLVCVSWAGVLSGARSGVAPAGRYAMIYNGIDVPDPTDHPAAAAQLRRDLGLPATTPIVGAVGRLTRQKNYDLLIEAAQRVCRRMPEVRVVIVGEGQERQRLERNIKNLGMHAHVLLPGYRPDVMAWVLGFDVFAMSSDWEGLPYSLLEAMACRRPIVATAVGGVSEAVRTDIDGVLTPPGDAGALADALIACLRASVTDRREMGESARRRIEQRFSRRRMLAAVQDLYEDVLSD